MTDQSINADGRSLIEKLNDRADRWQTWIDDDLPTEVGYSPDNMRYHQSLDRAAVGEIQRLTSDLALIQGIAALRNVVNAQAYTERDQERIKKFQAECERDYAVEKLAAMSAQLSEVADVMEKDGRFPNTAKAIRATLDVPAGCTRSHPHENMNAECERLTEIARSGVTRREES